MAHRTLRGGTFTKVGLMLEAQIESWHLGFRRRKGGWSDEEKEGC